MIRTCLTSGLKLALHNKRMLAIFYSINLLGGLIVMIPFRAALLNFAGNSLMGEKLAGKMDMDFLFEFITKNASTVSALTWLTIAAASLYWLVNVFLSGGAFTVFTGEETFSSSMFWSNVGTYTGRFFRLILWSLPVFVIFYSIQFLETLVVRLIWGNDPYQYITWWGGWIRTGLGYCGILLYLIVFDYARIYTIVSDERKMRRAMRHGLTFAFRNVFTTFGIAVILFIFGILLIFVYNPVADALHAPSVIVILLLLIVQQLYMLVRMTLRLTLYASQAQFYLQRKPAEKDEPLDSIDSVVIQPASG